ncbi:polysaccharide deacetylase family protein [Loktanella sp. DJP18]|uniref:polysaccharide deacetylase family protein n=1 Tax=Loktanella sp. DJP18 TaxID=3409788 RepID=UPI003BB6AF45
MADISTQAGSGQGIGKAPLLVTVDDAKRDIMEVHDLFKAAEIPVAQFVCAGWTAQASGHHNDDEAHLRVTAHLRFHAQKGETFDFEGRTYTLDTDGNTALIDALIMSDDRDTWLIAEERLNCPQPDQNLCTWSELRDLRDAGMTIGCHSVSHPRIARQSAVRRKFEIEASRFGIELQLGHSPYFAYPYGTPDSHDDSTLACLRAAGFVTAFTTRSAHRSKDDDPLVLPRIAMPEAVMPQAVFEARVKGAGIALQRVAGWIKP